MGQQSSFQHAQVREGRAATATAKWWTSIAIVVALAAAMLVPMTSSAQGSTAGGPVILTGIDSEAGGIGGHGPIGVYVDVTESILSAVRNGQSGILVIGATTGDAKEFWDEISTQTGEAVTYVDGASGIASATFGDHAMLAVVSSEPQMWGSNPGLVDAENEALIDRAGDIAAFVNAGGGLYASSQDGLQNEWGYIGGLGDFSTVTGLSYRNIEPTPAGGDIGITTALNLCCWHDTFTEWPDFLEVLAWRSGFNGSQAAVLGGVQVTIPTGIDLEPDAASRTVGETHALTAIVTEDEEPQEGADVTFIATDGPHAGTLGEATTDGSGVAMLEYNGEAEGLDTIEATYVDSLGRTQTSNRVTVEWLPAPHELTLAPTTANSSIGEEHTVTATLTDGEGQLVTEAEVTFTVIDGPHAGTTGSTDTDADGEATFTYTGDEVGSDRIVATYTPADGDEVTSNEATVAWVEVLAEGEESEEAEEAEEDEDDEVEQIEEADAADAVEAQPDFTG